MSSKCEVAFVLAAGRGERLRPLTNHTPKPLLPVKGKPILDYALRQLMPLGLRRVVLNAWHLGSQVIDYVNTRKDVFGFELIVSEEPELLGTGGGLRQAYPLLFKDIQKGPVLMVNGDCLWSGDVGGFVKSGLSDSAAGRWWLAPEESDQTPVGLKSGHIVQIGKLWSKPSFAVDRKGCFTGIQLFKELEYDLLPQKGCIIRDYWIPQLERGSVLSGDFENLDSWMDLGTPARYEKVRD